MLIIHLHHRQLLNHQQKDDERDDLLSRNDKQESLLVSVSNQLAHLIVKTSAMIILSVTETDFLIVYFIINFSYFHQNFLIFIEIVKSGSADF